MNFVNTSTLEVLSVSQWRESNPDVSLPTDLATADLTSLGVAYLHTGTYPHPSAAQRVIEGPVERNADGKWYQTYVLEELEGAERDEALAREVERLQTNIVNATQARLDNFARTRNYDNILSACTYAGSSVAKFQVEGQYCVLARDSTWAALYQVLAQVQAGTRPMPAGFSDVEPDLPALVWPEAP